MNIPSGVQAGDCMVVVISWDNSGTPTITPPSGWNPVFTSVGDATIRGSVYYRVAQAGDSSWSWTISPTNVDFGMACQTFSGVDQNNPIDATGTSSSNAGSGTITANAVTILTANAWHLIGSTDWINGSLTATNFSSVQNPSGNMDAAVLYNTTPVGTGSTGTVTVTVSSGATNQHLVAMPFALRPAAAAPASTGPAPGSLYMVGPGPSVGFVIGF
jgi:hypothetical protein